MATPPNSNGKYLFSSPSPSSPSSSLSGSSPPQFSIPLSSSGVGLKKLDSDGALPTSSSPILKSRMNFLGLGGGSGNGIEGGNGNRRARVLSLLKRGRRKPSSKAEKGDSRFRRFPAGCPAASIDGVQNRLFLAGEKVLGTIQHSASFPSYYFDRFVSAVEQTVLNDGQLLCTNYRILFVAVVEKEKNNQANGAGAGGSVNVKKEASPDSDLISVSIPYRALTSIRVVDRFAGDSSFFRCPDSLELLWNDEFTSTTFTTAPEKSDINLFVHNLFKSFGSTINRCTPKLLVFSCVDFRREVFFIQNSAIAQVIADIAQELVHTMIGVQSVENFGCGFTLVKQLNSPTPSISSPLQSSPLQTLLDRLNATYGGGWVKSNKLGNCDTETAIPAKMTQEQLIAFSQTFGSFPQPSSVNKTTGSILWKASNLAISGESLDDFFVAAQTRDLPFLILVAGNRYDYQLYTQIKLPEKVSSGVVYLCVPLAEEFTKAFLELSEHTCLGPLLSSSGINILDSDDDSTGIAVDNLSSIGEPSTPKVRLKNWVEYWENSHWYGCTSQLLQAAKVLVRKMEEPNHVLLVSDITNMLSILVEVIREPQCRTIKGLANLLERECLQPFNIDVDPSVPNCNLPYDKITIVLLIVFDAISQIMLLNPTRFEFNHDLLLFIIDENLMCRFDSSITLSRVDREKLYARRKPFESLWSYVSANISPFHSPKYDFNDVNSTQPLEVPYELIPWSQYSLKHHMKTFSCELESTPKEFKKLAFPEKGLSWFPVGVLYWWSHIHILDLSDNCLSSLPPEINTLRQLTVLRFANNNLVQIGPNDIGPISSLHEIDFSGNRLREISGLEKLKGLMKLKINGNRLRAMPLLPPTLQRLSAGENPFSTHTWTKFPPPAVLSLSLSKGSLSSLPYNLSKAKKLQLLHLNGNHLKTLSPTTLSHLSNISSLDLSENPLRTIPQAIFSLKKLNVLLLSHCNLSEVDSKISELNSLEELVLSNNQLTSISEELCSLTSLCVLDLSGNQIKEVPHSFSQLLNLQELFLARNDVSRLPSELAHLTKLQKIDTSFCKLQYVDPAIGNLTSLRELEMKGNFLQTPPPEIVSKGFESIMGFLRSIGGPDVHRSYKIKVSVVGPHSGGKTSIIEKLRNCDEPSKRLEKTFSSSSLGQFRSTPTNLVVSEVTVPLNITSEGVGSQRQVTLTFWEFEGTQELTQTNHQFFLTDRSLYFVVFSLLEPLESAHLDYWISSIKKKAPYSPVIVITTYLDKVAKSVATTVANKILSRFGPQVEAVVAVSSSKAQGYEKLWEAIGSAIREFSLGGEMVPNRFCSLEKSLKTNSPPLITWKDFETKCDKFAITQSEAESALFLLSSTGSRLLRLTDPPELSGWVCTDSCWLVDMVAKIARDTKICSNGILPHSSLGQIWTESFDQCQGVFYPYLIGLLTHFQLGFCVTPDIPDFSLRSTFFPMQLQKERPSDLDKEWPVFSEAEWCKREYSFEILPEGFFARCQVNLLSHRTSSMPLLAWANGILIRTNEEAILFEQLPTAKRIQFTMRHKISGNVFALIDEDIKTLAKMYNLQLKVTMPCVHCYRKKVYDVNEFTLRECEMALESDLSVVYCHGLVPVRLDKIAPDIALAAVSGRKIDYNRIELLDFLAEGGFASVYRGKYQDLVVAVKVLKTKEEEENGRMSAREERGDFAYMEELRREIWTMSGLSHPNILSLIGYCISPPCIISSFIPEGNLLSFICDHNKPMSMGFLLRIVSDVTRALEFLHVHLNPPMTHNDLKSPNVLLASLSETSSVVAKLADFGMSRRAAWRCTSEVETLNPRWLSPEVLLGQPFTNKTDIYSFGIILWELLSRKMFMAEETFMHAIHDKVVAGSRPPLPDCTFPQLAELVSSCWNQKPEDRPDITKCNQIVSDLLTDNFPELADYAQTAFSSLADQRRKSVSAEHPPEQEKKTLLHPTSFTYTGSIRCMVFCSKWKQVWCGDGSGILFAFRTNGTFLDTVPAHSKELLGLVPTSDYVFSLATDETMKVWNKKFELVRSIPVGNSTAICKVQGRIWVASDSVIQIFDKRTFKVEKKLKLSSSDTAGGWITCILSVKPYVWLGTSSGILRMDERSNRIVDFLPGHTRIIHNMIAIEDEVWSCSSDRSIRVWDQITGRQLHVLNAHSGRVFNLAVEVGLKPIVWSCAWDSTILIWNAETKQLLHECSQFHRDGISSLVQVGGYMWSASWDQKICRWQTIGMRKLLEPAQSSERETQCENPDLFSLAMNVWFDSN